MKDVITFTWDAIICVLLAVLGGFARMLNIKDSQRLRVSRILSELFVSGFIGIVILMAGRASGVTGDWLGVLCGIAGWIGPKVLDVLVKQASKTTGVRLTPEEEKEGEKQE